MVSKRSAMSPRRTFIQMFDSRSPVLSFPSPIWSTMDLASSRMELKLSVISS